MCDQQNLRSACAYAQSDQSLCLSLEYSMSVKLLTEHNFEFLSFKGGCTGSPESTPVKMPHCWKSHDTAQMFSEFDMLSVDKEWTVRCDKQRKGWTDSPLTQNNNNNNFTF